MARLSIQQVVREVDEPRRTQILEELVQASEAVVLVYKPDPRCPAWRKDGYTVHHGLPARTMRFLPGKPKAVSIGLAVMILSQCQEAPTNHPDVAWYDGEWEEANEAFEVQAPVVKLNAALQEEKAALRPVTDEDEVVTSDDDTPEEEDQGDGKPYLSQMNKNQLLEVYEEELGMDESADELTRAQLIEAIRTHRESEGTDEG